VSGATYTEAGGFTQLVRAEWTKFRTVRGWVLVMAVAALVTVLIGLLTAAGALSSCGNQACPAPPAGPGGLPASAETFRQAGGRFTVSGSGDIAPDVPAAAADTGTPIAQSLVGTFAGLIVVIVVGTMSITAEYRRGLIRTTLAAGALLRRSAVALTAVIAVIVLPYFLAVASPVLAAGPADWLLRVTPAAAFAIQQSLPRYPQVIGSYTPFNGYFPLAPWAGLAVLCGWAVLALGLAVIRLRRTDA